MSSLQSVMNALRFEQVYIIPPVNVLLSLPKIDLLELYNLTSSPQTYSGIKVAKWATTHMGFVYQLCLLYLCIVFGGKYIMKKRQPFELRKLLVIWNAFLTALSIYGVSYIVPELIEKWKQKGLVATYCLLDDFSEGPVGFATGLFVFSKIPELFDTVFLILRKKPISFLHWFHHVLTLFYAFLSLSYFAAFNRWTITLNLTVHSGMYSYYFLRSLRIKVPGIIAKIITVSQITQFILGLLILIHIYFMVYVKKVNCVFNADVFKLAVFMNGVYLILFINFFFKAYIIDGGKAKYKNVIITGKQHKN